MPRLVYTWVRARRMKPELAGTHPPGVGEELADQGAVAARIRIAGEL